MKLPITFTSRSDIVSALRVDTQVTWLCPVDSFTPLSGKGHAFDRWSGNRSESIVYPPHFTASIGIKKLEDNPSDIDFDALYALEFLVSTCSLRESFTVDASIVRGIRRQITCKQISKEFSLNDVKGSPKFMETTFTFRTAG